MDANRLLVELRTNPFLYALSGRGNKKLWFSTEIPKQLPVSNATHIIGTEELPTKLHLTIADQISGWMSYWRHTSGTIQAATTFLTLEPIHSQKGTIQILHHEVPIVNPLETYPETPEYGLFESFLEPFCQGLLKGLTETAYRPITGVKISILNAIMDPIYSTQKTFEWLGQWLVEALILELCRRELIQNS